MALSEEILNVKWLESSSPSWTRSVLSHDQALKWAKAKVFVYSDSVLCLGMMHESKDGPLPTKKQWESMEKQLNSSGIFSQDFSSFPVLQEIQKGLARKNIKPEEFRDRIIFMSTFDDIDWTKTGKDGICISNSESQRIREEILARTLNFSRSWVGMRSGMNIFLLSKGEWAMADKMVQRFKESDHPVFRSISALSRGILKKGRDNIHSNGDSANTELLF